MMVFAFPFAFFLIGTGKRIKELKQKQAFDKTHTHTHKTMRDAAHNTPLYYYYFYYHLHAQKGLCWKNVLYIY